MQMQAKKQSCGENQAMQATCKRQTKAGAENSANAWKMMQGAENNAKARKMMQGAENDARRGSKPKQGFGSMHGGSSSFQEQ